MTFSNVQNQEQIDEARLQENITFGQLRYSFVLLFIDTMVQIMLCLSKLINKTDVYSPIITVTR